MCFRNKSKTVVLENDDEPIEGDVVYVRSPRRSTSRLAKENDAETYSANQGSMAAIIPDPNEFRRTGTTLPQYRLRMKDFLTECGLDRKYLLKFKRQGVETIDDFMSLDASDLGLLDIEEDDLATILILIQN